MRKGYRYDFFQSYHEYPWNICAGSCAAGIFPIEIHIRTGVTFWTLKWS